MAKPKSISTGIAAVDKALRTFHSTSSDPFDGARLIEGVQLAAGVTKRVIHGLGRKPRGYLVVKASTGAVMSCLYDETHADSDVYLYLRAEGYSPVVSLLIF